MKTNIFSPLKRLFSGGYLSVFIVFILVSCKKEVVVEEAFKIPQVDVLSVYSRSSTDGEANLTISYVSTVLTEVGIVWSEKSGPTVSDSRQSFSNLKTDQSLFVTLDKLQEGKTYYIRGYFILNGKTYYSTDETTFTQKFTLNWLRFPSPIVSAEQFISSENVTYSGYRGGILFYRVDRYTNLANEAIFYPNFNQWDVSFFTRNNTLTPMRYSPFVASFFVTKTIEVTMIGSGYYRKPNGTKFFIKDVRIEGIDGYKWDPEYPGADITASGFGLRNKAYALENRLNGVLWRYDSNTIKWDSANVAPKKINTNYVSFDIGERAFVLTEPEDWSTATSELFEYDLDNNKWIKKADFKGENRRRGLSFVLNGKIYYGAGQSAKTLKGIRDIWEYNPATDAWKKVSDYPGSGTVNLAAVGVDNKYVYIGFGKQVSINAIKSETFKEVNDFWRFQP